MNSLNDLKRKLLGEAKADGLNLPTEPEINPEENSYDGRYAVEHFLGKTREQITKEWAEHGHYYQEDLHAMGCRAFCFYLPAVVDYVTTDAIRDDNDTVNDLCRVIESRLKNEFPEMRETFPEIVRFADFVLTHYRDFGQDPEFDEGLRARLLAIRQQSAELAALSAPKLGERWIVTRQKGTEAHLETACRLLPKPPAKASGEFERRLKEYHEFVAHNELEHALDMLQKLGELVPCRGGYWRNLERAAGSMALAVRLPYLRSRFEQTGGRLNERSGGYANKF